MGLSSVLVRRRKKGGGEISTTEAEDDAVAAAGLRIVIVEVDDDEYSNKIVVRRSGLKPLTNNKDSGGFNCFLKSCHLCRKPLSPHKDVYMYRGDQGFCSIECRSRQIMVDEIKVKEDEIRKRRLQDYCVGCETCTLLRDLRKHQYLLNTTHKYYKSPNNDAFIISPAKHHQPLLSFS